MSIRVYNQTAFKALVPLVIGGLGVYFYAKNDLEKYLKLGVLVVFLGHNANQYFYILLTLALFNTKIFLPYKSAAKYLYLMIIFGSVSFLINQAVETNLYSFPFFIASFFFPIVIYAVAKKNGTEKIKREIIDFYLTVVFILSISAMYQFLFYGRTADGLTGGTTNAHTLGFHLAVAFIIYIGKVITSNKTKKLSLYEWILGINILPVLYLADAKYLLGNMIIASFIIFILFHTKQILKPFLIALSTFLIIFAADFIRTANIAISVKSDVDVSAITLYFTDSAKYELFEKTVMLPLNEPLVFLIGSGPGTFLSRAANSRAYDTMDKKVSTGGGTSEQVESKLPSFIPPHTSWVTKEYAQMYFGQLWQGTLFDYRSSLISLFWEFGVVGFSLFLFFFYKTIKLMNRAKEKFGFLKLDAFFIQAFILFYFLNAVIAYYFEYPETQIIFWMFIGLFTNRELISNLSK